MDNFSKNIQKIEWLIDNRAFKILNNEEFEELITMINGVWGLRSFSRNKIKEFLFSNDYVYKESLEGETNSGFFIFKDTIYDDLDIASTRSRSSYFSHYTALAIHDLTIQIPKQIYLTWERANYIPTKKNKIIQSSLDSVFSKPPRTTSNKRVFKKFTVNFINGQAQRHIGIMPFREVYLVSDLERTLIDASVRPFYCGGVAQVLESYKKSKEKLDTIKLFEYYSRMNFTYPFHQVIGYYLEKAGYPESSFNSFLELDMELDFYLTYNILNKDYSNKWKLFIPKGL